MGIAKNTDEKSGGKRAREKKISWCSNKLVEAEMEPNEKDSYFKACKMMNPWSKSPTWLHILLCLTLAHIPFKHEINNCSEPVKLGSK